MLCDGCREEVPEDDEEDLVCIDCEGLFCSSCIDPGGHDCCTRDDEDS